MNKLLKTAVAAAICMVSLTGCLKGYDGDVMYVLKPMVSDGTDNKNTERYITAYAFYADTTRWTVASYEDALAMRITDRMSGRTMDEPAAVAEPFIEAESGGAWSVSMSLSPRTVMLVAVDTELKLYGYREQTLAEGLTSIFETVVFYTSRNARSYKAGQWMMFNDFYVEPDPEPEDPEDPEPEDPEEPENPENPEEPGGGDAE